MVKKSLLVAILFCMSSNAFASDAVTVIFKSGLVIKLEDGFKQRADAVKELDSDNGNKMFELSINGSTFLMKVNEIVVLCRDNCSPLTIQHQLDPSRATANTNLAIQNNEIRTRSVK